jgi:iduronate 2-sulfatase
MRQILVLSLLALVLSSCTGNGKEEQRPNFLVIFMDDLRPQLGAYGHSQMISPNIDRLASEGLLFERAYCQVPVCGASRASVMTGVRPTRNRFLTYHTYADEDLPGHLSLPRYLRESGYYTLSLGKVYHHNDDDPGGWTERPWRPGAANWRNYIMQENIEISKAYEDGRALPWEVGINVKDNDYFDGVTADSAIARLRFLKQQDKPFFLAVGFLKPHLPFNAPSRYWEMYDADSLKLASNPYAPENAPPESMHNWGELRGYHSVPERGPVTREMERKLVHGYYACVSYTDALIGKVLDVLSELGLDKNTVVMLFGDHGWNLGEHGLWCKHCNYDNAMRVPLIIRVPGKTTGEVSGSLAELLDIYPTVCELAGLELPDHLQGKSLLPVISDPEASVKDRVFSRYIRGESVLTGHYAYTEFLNRSIDTVVSNMLYDHQTDREENINISYDPRYRDLIDELSGQLRAVEEESCQVK